MTTSESELHAAPDDRSGTPMEPHSHLALMARKEMSRSVTFLHGDLETLRLALMNEHAPLHVPRFCAMAVVVSDAQKHIATLTARAALADELAGALENLRVRYALLCTDAGCVNLDTTTATKDAKELLTRYRAQQGK